jgi:hypothetical protein
MGIRRKFQRSGQTWHGRSKTSLHDAYEQAAQKSGKHGAWFRVEEAKVYRENPITEYYVLLSETDAPPP